MEMVLVRIQSNLNFAIRLIKRLADVGICFLSIGQIFTFMLPLSQVVNLDSFVSQIACVLRGPCDSVKSPDRVPTGAQAPQVY